jgi:hypothetical protein
MGHTGGARHILQPQACRSTSFHAGFRRIQDQGLRVLGAAADTLGGF